MTHHRAPAFAAFALSLAMTLAIFSSVTRLSAPEHRGALLVKAGTVPQTCI